MNRLQLAYPFVLWWLLPVLAVVALGVFFFKRRTRYRYALTSYLARNAHAVSVPVRHVLYLLRLVALFILTLLIARPQWVDSSTSTLVHGIDMVLALDVSGSMDIFDDLYDRTQRIDAAKREALDFIARRTQDPIGVVLFGAEALSKVPLTLDKALLRDVVSRIEIGDVNPDGTAIMTGLATAINRLRDSQSKNKIIVLLTDGMPSDDDEVSADIVINLAQEFGIKIYTLGVGQKDIAYRVTPYGVTQVQTEVDTQLLTRLAQETGGHFFRVYTPRDLHQAYREIDQLETTEMNTTLYHRYYEAFATFIWWFVLFFAFEVFLRTIWWRGV